MKRKTAVLAISAATLAMPIIAHAAPAAFGAPFTDHAVLQRDCEIPVWGSAEPGNRIEVSLDDATLATTAGDDGAWRVTFPPLSEPGFGHRLAFATNGVAAVALKDIAIGDIWLCAGQSNMEMSHSWGLARGRQDIERAKDRGLRFCIVLHAASYDPISRMRRPCEWVTCTPDTAKTFSACGFFFGQALRKALPDVPIGLVGAYWSGSPIKTWISAEAYAGADSACPAEVAKMRARRDAYEADGGLAGQRKRTSQWKADCKAAGDIGAERVDFDDSEWKTVELPTTFEKQFNRAFDGCAWYRRTVTLTAEQAAASGTMLKLGPIDDSDKAYVNGELVGATSVWGVGRSYKLRDGLLREGENLIAVRIDDEGGNGGFTSDKPNSLRLALPGLDDIPLAGEWRASKGLTYPPKPKDGGPDSWTVSACYNAMLHPLFPMALKGAIWYQGCSDVDHIPLYEKVLAAMVADWRTKFTAPDGMPFYIVQLAAYQKTHDEPIESKWAEMRWAQMRLGETLEKSGTAVTIDIGDYADIHPKDKKTVGERLARLALARTYGMEGIVEAGPIPVRAAIKSEATKHCVIVWFKDNAGLKTSDGALVRGFQVAGADGRFVRANADIDGCVFVHVPEGMEAKRIRYAWDDYPDCNLVGADDLPCGPFELPVR